VRPVALSWLVAVCAPAAAHADAALAWEAPDGCPPPRELEARVIEELGRPLRDGEVDAHLAVARRGDGWHVAMTVAVDGGAPGQRELEASTCADLLDLAALILALTIDPGAGAAPRSAAPADDRPRVPVPALARIHVDVPTTEPRRPLDLALRIRAAVGGDLGSLPDASPGLGAGVAIGIGPWSADAAIQRFAARQVSDPGAPARGAEVALTSVAVRGCYIDGGGGWRAGGCVGADLSLTHSDGFGFDDTAGRSTTPGGGPQAAATWAVRMVGPLAVRAEVAATWLAIRTVLTRDGGTVVHDPNSLVWRGFAGVEATWR
jgi:hypothetical protein